MKRFVIPLLALLIIAPCSIASDREWTVFSGDFRGKETAFEGKFFAPYCGNGEIGIVCGENFMDYGPVILGNAFRRGGRDDVSIMLKGVNPFRINIFSNGEPLSGVKVTSQSIDMRRAVHNTEFEYGCLRGCCSMRSMRNMPDVLILEFSIESTSDIDLRITVSHDYPDGFSEKETLARNLNADGKIFPLLRTSALYNEGKDRIVASTIAFSGRSGWQEGVSFTPGNIDLNLSAGQKVNFAVAAAICASSDFSDPWNEADRQAIYVSQRGLDDMVQAHERAWEELWKGDIIIDGEPEVQRNVRFAIYNLYSSIRAGSGRSISPMGLSSRGYSGHVFWDTEIWMYPALLVLQPELARQMVDYRADRLNAALKRASAYGYKGAMFPWESDDLGEESTPTWALTGPLEHHITADIAIACWNYYCVTGDTDWLKEKGWPLIKASAEFWTSRATANPDGSYSILNVIGANEYAVGVNDNAYTNGSAKKALEYAVKAAGILGEGYPEVWISIRDGLRFPKFSDGVSMEHSTYSGEMIKQADVNLLSYPLDVVSDRESILRNLEYYEPRIDPRNGPAMSWSVFSIQYARLGMTEKAEEMFHRAYIPNLRPPFGVFAETATSGNPYFMTGAGGMLQAVLFGFGGLRITEDGLVRDNVALPSGWEKLRIFSNGREIPTPNVPSLRLRLADALQNVVIGQPVPRMPDDTIRVARGENAVVQIVVDVADSLSGLVADVDFQLPAETGWVHWVRASHQYSPMDPESVVSPTGLYPDPILSGVTENVAAGGRALLHIDIPIGRDVAPGVYSGTVHIRGKAFQGAGSGRKVSSSIDFTVRVYPVILPEQSLLVTNWYFPERFHWMNGGKPVKEGSRKYWDCMKAVVSMAAAHGQNVWLLKPRGRAYVKSDGSTGFDFSEMDKHIEFLLANADVRCIEADHIGKRSNNGWTDPFLTSVPIEAYFSALQEHLKSRHLPDGRTWLDIWLQHIADEPIPENLNSWESLATRVKKAAPEMKIIEAYRSPENKPELIDVLVPQLDEIMQDGFRHIDKGQQCWFYTCMYPRGRFANRYVTQPLVKTRLLHWINFRFSLPGYLHWGFNYWGENGDPFGDVSAPLNDWPGGDSHIVYPGHLKVYPSIRLKAMRDGIRDYELLRLAQEVTGRDFSAELIRDYNDCEISIASFRELRKRILECFQ